LAVPIFFTAQDRSLSPPPSLPSRAWCLRSTGRKPEAPLRIFTFCSINPITASTIACHRSPANRRPVTRPRRRRLSACNVEPPLDAPRPDHDVSPFPSRNRAPSPSGRAGSRLRWPRHAVPTKPSLFCAGIKPALTTPPGCVLPRSGFRTKPSPVARRHRYCCPPRHG